VILLHGTAHGAPPRIAVRSSGARRVSDSASAQITYREPDQVSMLLDGCSLVEPGLVHIAEWRPPEPVSYEFDGFLAAVGRRD
jgi:S-adenosyl methyltransferase